MVHSPFAWMHADWFRRVLDTEALFSEWRHWYNIRLMVLVTLWEMDSETFSANVWSKNCQIATQNASFRICQKVKSRTDHWQCNGVVSLTSNSGYSCQAMNKER